MKMKWNENKDITKKNTCKRAFTRLYFVFCGILLCVVNKANSRLIVQ